jgi:stage II sporulation protein R
MRKILKVVGIFALLAAIVYMGGVIRDKKQLSDNILRLHVVANSDSEADQAVKLQVRDAVLEVVDDLTANADSRDAAETVIRGRLDELEQAANAVLRAKGFSDRAAVTLTREEFPTREYDTFSLPAGVYDSLRVTIGSGEGRNWWCVVFPSLCVPAASDGTADMAVGAGFSDSLTGAITEEPEYEVRFFLLDCIGYLENLFHKG